VTALDEIERYRTHVRLERGARDARLVTKLDDLEDTIIGDVEAAEFIGEIAEADLLREALGHIELIRKIAARGRLARMRDAEPRPGTRLERVRPEGGG
jgi:hypothetical protein